MPINVSYVHAKFGGHSHSGGEDVVLLLCHESLKITRSKDHKTLCVGVPHDQSLPKHRHCESGDTNFPAKYGNLTANTGCHIHDCICSLTSAIVIFSKAHDMSCSHKRNFRLRKNLHKHFSVCEMKLLGDWTHAYWVTVYEKCVRNFCKLKNIFEKERKKKRQLKVFCATRKRNKDE